MATRTLIEWCHHTGNLWWGCSEIHRGCDHCYARIYARAKGKRSAWEGDRFAVAGVWDRFVEWQDAAARAGEVRRVFVGSMMDIFEKSTPAVDWRTGQAFGLTTGELRDRYFREVVPATPNLLHLCLTKRPSNILGMVPGDWLRPGRWPANVMTGTSPVDQATADTLIPQLVAVPGPHFLSCEPLLGSINFRYDGGMIADGGTGAMGFGSCALNCMKGIRWVIVGGESGPQARPPHPDWVRGIRNQCTGANVPFFFKQWGEYQPVIEYPGDLAPKIVKVELDGTVDKTACREGRVGGTGRLMYRVGKKAAGRRLDGRIHDAFPAVAEAVTS